MNAPTEAGPMFKTAHPAGVEHTLVVLGPPGQDPAGFLLGASRLSVGAGEADDVYLTAVGVVPAHLKMIYIDGEITLLAAAQPVRINGQPVTSFPMDLKPLQVLSLTPDTHLAYGPVGSTWPSPIQFEGGSHEGNEFNLGGIDNSTPTQRLAEAQTDPVRQGVVNSARWGSVVVGVTGLLMVLVIMFDLIWGNLEFVNPGDVAIDQSSLVLDSLLKKDPVRYGHVAMDRRKDGVITLRGFVDSEADYQVLSDAVRQQGVNSGGNVRLDALTSGRLLELVRDQIGRYPLDSQIDVKPDRIRLRIFGLQDDTVDESLLMSDLTRMGQRVAPRTLSIQFDFMTAEQASEEINAFLAKSPITREFQFVTNSRGGVVKGTVAQAAEDGAQILMSELLQAFAGRLPLTTEVKVDAKLNFNLVGVTLSGELPTATLMQRGRLENYQLGDPVFGTGVLKEILREGVVLGLGRRDMFIPLPSR